MLLQVAVKGNSIFRKEVVWWNISVVLIEVVSPLDSRRAVQPTATVSNQITDPFEKQVPAALEVTSVASRVVFFFDQNNQSPELLGN